MKRYHVAWTHATSGRNGAEWFDTAAERTAYLAGLQAGLGCVTWREWQDWMETVTAKPSPALSSAESA